jgi:hypothetical protein
MELMNEQLSITNSNWTRLPVTRRTLKGEDAIRQYVEEIGGDAQLCALYLDADLQLLGATRWSGAAAPDLGKETSRLLNNCIDFRADGFILARTDPGKTYRPGPATLAAIGRLRQIAAEYEMPLLDYLVFPSGETVALGGIQGSKR